MDIINLKSVYYSPQGTTKKVIEALSEQMTKTPEYIDLTSKSASLLQCDVVAPVIVAMPVFAGRLPAFCTKTLQGLKGDGKWAIAVVVYGNREYDDALLELCDILKGCGFSVLAAGAFVAQHSIFNEVAKSRPDEQDISDIQNFAQLCCEKVRQFETVDKQNRPKLEIKPKGDFPYKLPSPIPLKPKASNACNGCKKCVEVCLANAISADNPKETDNEKCISCTACIAVCPQRARSFNKLVHKAASLAFQQKCSTRKANEWFV